MTTTRSLGEWAELINAISVSHGFWPDDPPSIGDRNFGEMIALMHSELTEALESHREGEPSVFYKKNGETLSNKPEGWAVELIDCIIRALDTLAVAGINVDMLMQEKCDYNLSRPRLHGKRY